MPKPYWIKERYNPQLGTSWHRCGQMFVKDAMRRENALYGENVMHRFNTLEEYANRIEELILEGQQVR